MDGHKYMFASESDAAEFDRLENQSLIHDWLAIGRASAFGLGVGSTCLEVGPGAGSMARWMAGVVGPSGRVDAIDISERFFPALQLPHINKRLGDIRSIELEESIYDIIHARLVLLHLPQADRVPVLERLRRSLKPGGSIIVCDPGHDQRLSLEPNEAEILWDRLLKGIVQVFIEQADYSLGTRLPELLVEGGYVETGGVYYMTLPTPGSVVQDYMIPIIDLVRRLTAGRTDLPFSNEDLDQLSGRIAECRVAVPLGFAWGRRGPAEGQDDLAAPAE